MKMLITSQTRKRFLFKARLSIKYHGEDEKMVEGFSHVSVNGFIFNLTIKGEGEIVHKNNQILTCAYLFT